MNTDLKDKLAAAIAVLSQFEYSSAEGWVKRYPTEADFYTAIGNLNLVKAEFDKVPVSTFADEVQAYREANPQVTVMVVLTRLEDYRAIIGPVIDASDPLCCLTASSSLAERRHFFSKLRDPEPGSVFVVVYQMLTSLIGIGARDVRMPILHRLDIERADRVRAQFPQADLKSL